MSNEVTTCGEPGPASPGSPRLLPWPRPRRPRRSRRRSRRCLPPWACDQRTDHPGFLVAGDVAVVLVGPLGRSDLHSLVSPGAMSTLMFRASMCWLCGAAPSLGRRIVISWSTGSRSPSGRRRCRGHDRELIRGRGVARVTPAPARRLAPASVPTVVPRPAVAEGRVAAGGRYRFVIDLILCRRSGSSWRVRGSARG